MTNINHFGIGRTQACLAVNTRMGKSEEIANVAFSLLLINQVL